MRKLVALAIVLASCGGDATPTSDAAPTTTAPAAPSTTAAPTTTTAAPESTTSTEAPPTTATTTTAATGSADIRIEEIVFAGEPFLVIGNGGPGAGSTNGYWICQFPTYFALPDVELQPGEKLAVPLGEGDVPELVGVVAVAEASSPVGIISAAGGELGLYTSSEFNSPAALVDYLEWGIPDHGRSAVAVEAGQWTAGGFVEMPAEVLTIVAQNFPTTGPQDWFAEIGG